MFGECELVKGSFEKDTVLPTPGRASQTDLLALLLASPFSCGATRAESARL
jgi:hypothetical protein